MAQSREARKRAGTEHETLTIEAAGVTHTPHTPRKQEQLIRMLEREEGASIGELAAEVGWQTHSVRGFISGFLKKRSDLNVVVQKGGGPARNRVEESGVSR